MGDMKDHKDNEILVDILGIILVVAIVGSIICGILECFNVNTGIIGGVFGIIPALFLAVFVIWQIIKEK
jgi:uncharacterized membrane protein